MKKYFFAVAFILTAFSTSACSICGCGGGNLYLGLYPSFKSKFIGIRYNHSEFSTILQNDHTQFSNNYYNSIEIWSGFNLGKKWQVFAFIPYHFNNQIDDDSKKSKTGMGDVSLLASYNLLNTQRIIRKSMLITNQVWVGGGLKLNTGTFNINPNDPNTTLADINTQIGTGSNDFIINARDVYQINNWGLTSTVNFKFGTKNKQGYQFGNKLSINSISYYNIKYRKTLFSPNIGLEYEYLEGNKVNGNKVILSEGLNTGSYETGGHSLNFIGGMEVNISNITIGFNIQTPLKQDFAAGQTNMKIKGMAHISFVF